MSRRQLVLIFALSLPLLLVAWLPLRLVLGMADLNRYQLSTSAVGGTVWNGRLGAATWRGRPFGDLSVGLLPISELTGTHRLRVAGRGWSATIASGRVQGIENANGQIELSPLSGSLPVAARLLLKDGHLTFSEGRCRRAEGSVSADVFLSPAEKSGVPLRLHGSLACQEKVAALVMVSSGSSTLGSAQAQVRIEIDASGQYRMQSLVKSADTARTGMLQVAGFQHGPAGLSRVDSGSLSD